jgi:hypothetical protein
MRGDGPVRLYSAASRRSILLKSFYSEFYSCAVSLPFGIIYILNTTKICSDFTGKLPWHWYHYADMTSDAANHTNSDAITNYATIKTSTVNRVSVWFCVFSRVYVFLPLLWVMNSLSLPLATPGHHKRSVLLLIFSDLLADFYFSLSLFWNPFEIGIRIKLCTYLLTLFLVHCILFLFFSYTQCI